MADALTELANTIRHGLAGTAQGIKPLIDRLFGAHAGDSGRLNRSTTSRSAPGAVRRSEFEVHVLGGAQP